MRKKLMATVAMAALIGGTSVALAQQEEHGGGAAAPGAAQHQTAPGGAGGAKAPGAGGQIQMKPQSGGMGEQQKSVQGGAEEHGNAPMQRGAQGEPGKVGEPGKGGMNAQEHAQTPGGKGDQNAQTQERGKTQENAQGTQERGGASQQNAQGRASGGKSVQLNETQRTQIKGIVVKDRNVTRVDHVDFSVNVGVAVPRTINVAVLPADIVEVVPEYRGFEYVVVGDQLLIIDPNTMLIVDILPV